MSKESTINIEDVTTLMKAERLSFERTMILLINRGLDEMGKKHKERHSP